MADTCDKCRWFKRRQRVSGYPSIFGTCSKIDGLTYEKGQCFRFKAKDESDAENQ